MARQLPEETYSHEAPICPYCGHAQPHDDGALYDEDLTNLDCGNCEKVFEIRVYTSTSWTCKPIEEA